MSLVIFHYHLLPGGVTNVIVSQIRALRINGNNRPIVIACGRKENTENIRSILNSMEKEYGIEEQSLTKIHVHKQLDYLYGDPSAEEAKQKKQDVINLLTERYKGAVWWVHNYHLGKNPLFTEALLRILYKTNTQKTVFHIHDFPECGRYENLNFLKKHCFLPLYPIFSNVMYALINGRDAGYLKKAGIPENNIVLLPNPISGTPLHTNTAADSKRLAGRLSEYFPGFDADSPYVLYPVRTIRRKNVLEAGYISLLSKKPVNLVVTLPGVSRQEKAYSDIVEKTFREEIFRGVWGIGALEDVHDIPFQDIIAGSSAVISTAVQEGFGLLFLNSLEWGKPLFARYLRILDGISEVFNEHPHSFYSSLKVRLNKNERKRIFNVYNSMLNRYSGFIPEAAYENLKKEVHDTFNKNIIDFAFLDVEGQLEKIKTVFKNKEKDIVRSLNEELFNGLYNCLEANDNPAVDAIENNFGLKKYGELIHKIITKVEKSAFSRNDNNWISSNSSDFKQDQRMVELFAHIENFFALMK